MKSFTLTLNSDLIARAPNLNFYDRLDPTMLTELADLETFSTKSIDWRTFSETIEVRGFNARSGLPRVPALAIRRGSSICIAGSNANQLYQKLAELPALGERQWEGFGRFELDFSPLERETAPAQKTTVRLKTKHREKKESHLTPEIGQHESLLKKAFELAEKIPKPQNSGEGGPTKTQWQYLRQQVNIANDEAGILRCLEDLQAHTQKRAGKPWEKACLPEMRRMVETDCQSLKEAQFFINGLVRKQWLKLKDV
ncbi:hypothetical protein BGP_1995 [Beggiatoa sp. PS]|nr:hypothetical protein BGP_1995 [Beggiatoa sp. PS]